MNIHPAAR